MLCKFTLELHAALRTNALPLITAGVEGGGILMESERLNICFSSHIHRLQSHENKFYNICFSGSKKKKNEKVFEDTTENKAIIAHIWFSSREAQKFGNERKHFW